jgi:hypothetical protein
MNALTLELILDRAAISDVVRAYATGLDRRDQFGTEGSTMGVRRGTYTGTLSKYRA